MLHNPFCESKTPASILGPIEVNSICSSGTTSRVGTLDCELFRTKALWFTSYTSLNSLLVLHKLLAGSQHEPETHSC